MKRSYGFIALIATTLFLFAFIGTFSKKSKAIVQEKGFAVVELFTSEGCSSCPPADDAVAALAKQYAGTVYVVAFHVDYWNRLGWKDVFSKAAYSERQKQYAALFKLNSIYTPQVIVNGKKEFVGSDRSVLRTTVDNEVKNGSGQPIKLTISQKDDKEVTINYSVAQSGDDLLNIALVQIDAATNVAGGENKGRQLHHMNIVRDYKTVALKDRNGMVQLELPEGIDKSKLKIIAYLQDKNNWHIAGANELSI